MTYLFISRRTPAGMLWMRIQTDKTGTFEVLDNRYLVDYQPMGGTVEEYSGEIRVADSQLTVLDADGKFTEIFTGITSATCAVGVDDHVMAFGWILLDSWERTTGGKTGKFTVINAFAILGTVTVDQVYNKLVSNAAWTLVSCVSSQGTKALRVCSLSALIQAICQLAGLSASVSFETTWRFRYNKGTPHPISDLLITETMFSEDLTLHPWSFHRHDSAASLLGELQLVFFSYAVPTMDNATGNVSVAITQRFRTSAAVTTISGGLREERWHRRWTDGVVTRLIAPEQQTVFLWTFEDGNIDDWSVVSANEGEKRLSLTAKNGVYGMSLSHAVDHTSRRYMIAVEYSLTARRTTERATVSMWHVGVGPHRRTPPYRYRPYVEIYDWDGNLIETQDLPLNERSWREMKLDCGSAVRTVRIIMDALAQLPTDDWIYWAFDDINLEFSGRPTRWDVSYGVVDRDPVEIDVPFMLDEPDPSVELLPSDAGRFLYVLESGVYRAVQDAVDGAGVVHAQLTNIVAAEYWGWMGGLRQLVTRKHRGLLADDGTGATIGVLRELSRVPLSSSVGDGEIIDYRKHPGRNELEYTAIERNYRNS